PVENGLADPDAAHQQTLCTGRDPHRQMRRICITSLGWLWNVQAPISIGAGLLRQRMHSKLEPAADSKPAAKGYLYINPCFGQHPHRDAGI
ncbi:MAG TPA: hypothetical protein VF498_13595, partial [Anaerolineales bacterium]